MADPDLLNIAQAGIQAERSVIDVPHAKRPDECLDRRKLRVTGRKAARKGPPARRGSGCDLKLRHGSRLSVLPSLVATSVRWPPAPVSRTSSSSVQTLDGAWFRRELSLICENRNQACRFGAVENVDNVPCQASVSVKSTRLWQRGQAQLFQKLIVLSLSGVYRVLNLNQIIMNRF